MSELLSEVIIYPRSFIDIVGIIYSIAQDTHAEDPLKPVTQIQPFQRISQDRREAYNAKLVKGYAVFLLILRAIGYA